MGLRFQAPDGLGLKLKRNGSRVIGTTAKVSESGLISEISTKIYYFCSDFEENFIDIFF